MDAEGDGYYSASPSMKSLHDPRDASSQEPYTPTPSTGAYEDQDEPAQSIEQYEEQHEGDERDYDVDSACDNESFIGDDTRSLASYITDYRFEHGRRYHAYKDGAYWGPNDEYANDTMDIAHHMYNLTLDSKLHLAPIKEPYFILDVGTGTGMWAIDMADTYPMASVIGVDLSPIQPAFVPPNCSFEIDDLTMDWTYPENHFDFIHLREMFGSIPDWDALFDEAYRCTKPGGWVEIVEHAVEPVADDGSQPEGHFYWEWGATVVEMGERNGKTFKIWEQAREKMEAAGFVDVTEVPYKWPMNGWSADRKMKEIGRWNQLRLDTGVEGFMMRLLTNVGNWSPERASVFLMQMRRQIRDYSAHSYLPGTVVYGRKP